MTVTPGTAIDSREFGERYTAFQNQMGQSACLIELGLSVDQECEHGNIPSGRHPNPACGCWPVTHPTEPEREQHMAALREGNARTVGDGGVPPAPAVPHDGRRDPGGHVRPQTHG